MPTSFAPDRLAGRSWTFGRDGETPFADNLILHPGGDIGNFVAENEARWLIEDGMLCFVNRRGSVTTKFTSMQVRDDGSLRLCGRFRLDLQHETWFFLDEHTLPLSDVISRFENLGDDCEFGLVQRYFGLEPLGLFRFNWISMDKLLPGLDSGFAGLDDIGNIHARPDIAGEFIIHDDRYGFAYHSGRYVGQISPEELLRGEVTRLRFLRSKFFDDLHAAEKILIRKGSDSRDLGQVLPLYQRLRRFGPNTLLWVVATDMCDLVGRVERLDQGLLRGYVRRFAPYTFAGEFAADDWGRLCKAAWQEVFGTRNA